MTRSIKWNFNLYVDKGPSINLADQIDAEAYDQISVQIRKGGAPQMVDVQPVVKGRVQFLSIKSDQYDQTHVEPTKKLFYKSGNGTKEIKLDRAHVLIGSSLVNLLEDEPKQLTFVNSTDNDANVEILTGRMATPSLTS